MTGYSIHLDPEGDVATVFFWEKFVSETILSAIMELKRNARYSEIVGVLWDLRQADLSYLTACSLREVFVTKNAVTPNKRLRIACLIAAEIDSYIMHLWAEGFDDDQPNIRRWFLDRDEAMAWLRAGDTGTA
ncbi:MAG: hypothetical protein NXI18_00040 [Alphaproteobacteria bacterium]|nr:hypothetical protein [Alphaproteobacteria bacterium]